MRIFHIHSSGVHELTALPHHLPEQGFVWIACARPAFQLRLAEIQQHLQLLTGLQLVDLHVSDLLNAQLPSHYDYTSQYDLLVFRRLAQGRSDIEADPYSPALENLPRRGGPPVLRRIDTSPVGFALFDQVLLTVHPTDCAVRDSYAARLLALTASGQAEVTEPGRSAAIRFMPSSSGDLMLRLVNQMVDGYLELRRELTRQLDHWQSELLSPNSRFNNWGSLLQARLALHQLDEICEDQRSAIQDWIEALDSWPEAALPADQRAHELLKVRSRDVLEHIERVVHHVRRLEQSAEVAVQMHFNAQGHRTNEIMRILTVLTAIFLPLNLIAGIFGMNFDFIPLLHLQAGFWWALAAMVVIAVSLAFYFWRKRFLEHRT